MSFTEIFNLTISLGTVVAQIVSVVLLFIIFSKGFRESFPSFCALVKRKSFHLSFLMVLFAMLGSLIYSDIIGYEPCKLCWFERIVMYPQVLILGIAMWRKDFGASIYAMYLSLIGIFIALYHYLGQFGISSLPCGTDVDSVSCSIRYVTTFGYITIPMMALTVFVLSFLALLVSRRNN